MVMPIVSVDQEFGDGKVQLISILGVWVTFGRLEGEGARPSKWSFTYKSDNQCGLVAEDLSSCHMG